MQLKERDRPVDTLNSSEAKAEINERMKKNLIAIGFNQDKLAFADFYDHFSGRIKSFLIGKALQEDIAEELAQEIMIIVWRKAASYDPAKAAPSTWLFTIARNRHIDYLRGNSRVEVELDDEMLETEDETMTQADHVELEQRSKKLDAALGSLPQEQRHVMHLSYFKGQSHGDIATWLGLPIGTVKSRIRLAMQAIRTEMETQE